MNKLISLVLLAIAASSAAAISEYDQEREIGLLMGHEKLFSQFCLDSYDYVRADIRKNVNEKRSLVFNVFFGATTEIADEVMNVEKQAVEELAKQVASPNTPVDEQPLSEDKVLALIEEGKREIQQRNFVGRVVAATKSAAQVLYNAANSAIFVRLAKLRSSLDASTLVESVKSACRLTKQYEAHMIEQLTSAKGQLAAENSEPEVQQFVNSVSVQTLKCFTPKTITRVSAFCDLLSNGAGAFLKMLGVNANKIDFSEN